MAGQNVHSTHIIPIKFLAKTVKMVRSYGLFGTTGIGAGGGDGDGDGGGGDGDGGGGGGDGDIRGGDGDGGGGSGVSHHPVIGRSPRVTMSESLRRAHVLSVSSTRSLCVGHTFATQRYACDT